LKAYRKQIGLLCFILAGLAWPIGFALGYKLPQVLPVHLFFIFSGIWLRGSHLVEVLKQKKKARP